MNEVTSLIMEHINIVISENVSATSLEEAGRHPGMCPSSVSVADIYEQDLNRLVSFNL